MAEGRLAGCVDSHAHLDFPQFNADREQVLRNAWSAGLVAIVNAGTDLRSSQAGVELARKYSRVFAAVGFHPHDAKGLSASALSDLESLAKLEQVVAVGEIGLDYYRDLSPRPVQRKAFEAQLELASRVGKPVIIHDRDAHSEVMATLRKWAESVSHRDKGVLHCFSGDLSMAEAAVEMGFFVAIGGPITYPNARRLTEVAAELPLDKLLVETDCPYLTPQAYRGRRNEPAYVRFVVSAIARVRGVPESEIARATTANAERLFGFGTRG